MHFQLANCCSALAVSFLTDSDVFLPDALFVLNNRLEILSQHGVEGAPDLVVEVFSPSNAHLDRGAKKQVYADNDVREIWLIDPQ
jgi:Uma2 family endonuclease